MFVFVAMGFSSTVHRCNFFFNKKKKKLFKLCTAVDKDYTMFVL